MKTLLLLRHAKSSWNDSSVGDHERGLNARGRGDAPRVGDWLRQQRLVPDLIISSDALRARLTAEAVAESAGAAGEIRLDGSLYLAGPADIVAVLQTVADATPAVMIVGHNPGLEQLVEQLTGESHDMPTAALARILLPIDRWRDLEETTGGTLAGLWRPADLD